MDINKYQVILTDVAKEELEEIYRQVIIYRIIYGKRDYLKIED